MAKNMKRPQVSQSGIQLSSWDDWFENCGQAVPLLTDYEEVLWNYYNDSFDQKEYDRMSALYAGHHASGFYNSEPLFQNWKIKKLASVGGIAAGVGFGVVFIISLIMNTIKHTGSVKGSVISAIVIGLLVGIVGGIVKYILMMQNTKKLRSKLDELDKQLRPRLQYLPPKYRNSIAVNFIYQTYLNYPGVITYNQAIQELESYLGSIPRADNMYIGKTIAVLFDVPYESTGLEGDAKDAVRGLYQSDESNPALANENLPKDIINKTFEGTEDPEKKLASLIGLSGVKKQVSQMKNRMEFHHLNGGRTEKISGNHMCFLGSPGTGKTTIARIITRILYDFGYIKENKCVEVDGGYFKSPYVGQTAMRTQAIIDYAIGGVLFIDEAYLMLDSKGNQGSAGTEATGTLLKNMEDRKNDFVVIFAGYEDAVNRLLGSNEGFASRIKYKIYFQDFNLEELMKIFDLDMKTYSKNGAYSIEPEARKMLEKQFDVERESPTFGNARVVRNALDKILDFHADNYMNGKIPKNKQLVFTELDVKEFIDSRADELAEDARNYIASQNLDNSIISFAELKGRTKEGSANPDKDLNALTGLGVVKDEIKKMKAQFEFYDGKMGNTEGFHMCFMGAPGTGKSTVAGIMTAYLYKMGIIQRNEYLDINGDFLRGMYLGHTGKRTQAVIEYCQGMVLFVDEAYLLQQDSTGDQFGQEAIGVLLDAMEKNRKNFVVIVAGYDKEMNEFLNANSGLRSRISLMFHFQSYTPHELALMMNHLARTDGFTVEKPVWLPLQKYVQSRVREPHFGNARFIRSFWQAVKKSHIVNFSNGKYDDSKKFVITLDDVKPVFDMNIQSEEKEKIPVPADYPDDYSDGYEAGYDTGYDENY